MSDTLPAGSTARIISVRAFRRQGAIPQQAATDGRRFSFAMILL
jgi:hypothetical protein